MGRHLTLVPLPERLRVVLSEGEVAQLLEAAPGVKYKAAYSVAYGAGLRVSEVANLKVTDIHATACCCALSRARARRTVTRCSRHACWRSCATTGGWPSRARGYSPGVIPCCLSPRVSFIGFFARPP